MRDFTDERGFGASGHVRAAETPVLEARGLSLELSGRALLHHVDLRIRHGGRMAIMGANGAGKSVLLRLLHGLAQPTVGTILWNGAPLDRSARRAQAMVFQRPVLLRRSVRANLGFALTSRGIKRAERAEREREALEIARLGNSAHRPARALSGGEQQRLSIARALACRPELLFLDEPTASLDPASTQAVEDLVVAAQSQGIATVLVTHDVGQARRLSDELAFLHAGRVAEAGPLPDLLHAPASPALQAWIDRRLYLEPAG